MSIKSVCQKLTQPLITPLTVVIYVGVISIIKSMGLNDIWLCAVPLINHVIHIPLICEVSK